MNCDPGKLNPPFKIERSGTFDWRSFLPVPPVIEHHSTSLGLYFCRICLEDATHTSPLEDGYLVSAFTGAGCTFTRKTDSTSDVGQLAQGDIIVTPPCSQLSWEIDGKAEFACIFLSVNFVRQVVASLGMTATEAPLIKGCFQRRDPLTSELLATIIREVRTGDYRCQIYVEAMARALCVHLLHHEIGGRTLSGYERTFNYEQMERIRSCVMDRLEERIFSADLASCVHISEYHFYRVFRRTALRTN